MEFVDSLILACNSPDKTTFVCAFGGVLALADIGVLQHTKVFVSSGWGSLLFSYLNQVLSDYSDDVQYSSDAADDYGFSEDASNLCRFLILSISRQIQRVVFSNQEWLAMYKYATGALNPCDRSTSILSSYNDVIVNSYASFIVSVDSGHDAKLEKSDKCGRVFAFTAYDDNTNHSVLRHTHAAVDSFVRGDETALLVGYSDSRVDDETDDKFIVAGCLPESTFGSAWVGDQDLCGRCDLDPLLKNAATLMYHSLRLPSANRSRRSNDAVDTITEEIRKKPNRRLVLLDGIRGNRSISLSSIDLPVRAETAFNDLQASNDPENVSLFRHSIASFAREDFQSEDVFSVVEYVSNWGSKCTSFARADDFIDLVNWGYWCTRKAYERCV